MTVIAMSRTEIDRMSVLQDRTHPTGTVLFDGDILRSM
jgi:hypothetical protein